MTNVRAAPRDRVDARTAVAAALAAVVVAMQAGHHGQTVAVAAGGRTVAHILSAVEGRNAGNVPRAVDVRNAAGARPAVNVRPGVAVVPAVDGKDRGRGGRDAPATSANPAP